MTRPKVKERSEARRLRREAGLSITAIAARLGVSRSSAYSWTADIPLTPVERDAIRELASEAIRRGRAAGNKTVAARAREKRLEAQLHGRRMARQNDPLHIAGCMLYWAEGSKRRNSAHFTNSDPGMVQHFLRFLRQCYSVEPEAISFTLNVHLNNGLLLSEIEDWWLRRLDLPATCAGSHITNRYSRASSRSKRSLPYGTARVCVNSTFVVQSIYGAIQEYTGVDRPEWVDL